MPPPSTEELLRGTVSLGYGLPPLHALSLVVAVSTLLFYILLSWALQLLFFYRAGAAARSWRLQPSAPPAADDSALPWLPLLRRKPGLSWSAARAAMVSFNTLLAAAAAGATAEAALRGGSVLHGGGGGGGWAAAAGALALSVSLQSVLVYYWHRAMHTRWLYAALHRHHHFNRAPTPFDDMLIHPLEAAGYYCILYCPAFIVRQHWAAFLAYMAIMGVAGIADHSGVRVSLPGVYDSADHDLHHSAFSVNFGFPFPLLDIFHGTFDGRCCGRRIRPAERWRRPRNDGGGGGGDEYHGD